MPALIEGHKNDNNPIVHGGEVLKATYFNLIRLRRGETFEHTLPGFESVYVVLSGRCDITVAGDVFQKVGQRLNIWSGEPDSVYAPADSPVHIRSLEDSLEIAVAGGTCANPGYKAFRIPPEEVQMVDVGSNATKSRRRIFHILGQNAAGRVGNLLVSELYADEGCWSGYPPHKHDQERGAEESNHEELYHYRYRPDNGFGAQLAFGEDGSSKGFMVRHGDTFLLDKGYHPTVTSPGHEAYIFTVLVGKERRSLIQHFKEDYQYLMETIPGIQEMRDKFR